MAGLLKAVADAALQHYGYARVTAEEPPPPASAPGALYTPWARGISPSLGLPPTKNQRQLLESYRSWVYSCIRAISFRVAGLPLDLVLNAREGTAAEVTRTTLLDHPFLDMMWKPNPFTSGLELWLTTINHLDLTGNAYWLLLCDALGIPREIWPLYPQYMRIVPHPTNMIQGYVYTVTSPAIKFEVGQRDYRIVHFKYPSPVSPYYGMGPLEAQAYAYDLDLYTEVYQRNFFSEGARPDFVFETEQKISKDEALLTLELWDERHKGPTKTWRPGILGSGLKAHALNVSNRDMAFAVLADWSQDKILAAYGVPRAKLGLVADVNRSNSDAADLTFNREAILPRCMLIERRIENDILPLYPGQSKTLWLEADFENPVPTDREAARLDRETNLKNFVTTVNEEREADGKEPVPWGDRPIAPYTMAPLGSPPPAPSVPAPAPAPAPAPTPEPPAEPTEAEIEAFRTRLWEAHIARTLPQEEAFIPDLNRDFRRQEVEVLARLEAHGKALDAFFSGWSAKKVRAHLQRNSALVDAILFDIEAETAKLVPVVKPHIESAVDAAGLHAIAEIGVGVWDLQDPAVLEWLASHGLEASHLIVGTTREALKATLIEGVAAGEGTPALIKRIKDVYEIATASRAALIARTEVNTASTWGTLQGYKQSGVVEEKEWLSARDERVRETHYKADGQRVGLSEDFQVGAGSGPGPGHIGLAEEDCNCRCDLLAVTSSGKAARHPADGDLASPGGMLGMMARLLERALSALTARPVAAPPTPAATVAMIERDANGFIRKVTKTPAEPGGEA